MARSDDSFINHEQFMHMIIAHKINAQKLSSVQSIGNQLNFSFSFSFEIERNNDSISARPLEPSPRCTNNMPNKIIYGLMGHTLKFENSFNQQCLNVFSFLSN